MRNNVPLLELKNIGKQFRIESGLFSTRGTVRAAHDVTFTIEPGEIVALVGESGSGKTTVGKMIQGLLRPDSGKILFDGKDASGMDRKERAAWTQMIFQDPYSSLNPKMTVGAALREAMHRNSSAGTGHSAFTEIGEILGLVGLPSNIQDSYPHQFSGGQRQRIVIARALALHPRLIVADEPVSALDVSIQAQILNLLLDLKSKLNLTYLLITHDLPVVEYLSDRVLVMRDGELVEQGPTQQIFSAPQNPYTQKLLSAALPLTV